jgi:uncharacterized Zn-binding protein involved in type VI secretion
MKPFTLQMPGGAGYMTHAGFIPPTFATLGVACSSNVKINGSFAHRVGDVSEQHCTPTFPPICDVETVIVGENTSKKVLINGRPAAFVSATTVPGPITLHYCSLTVFASA